MDQSVNTVADAFAQSAAQYGANPFLCVLPETAAIYGVAAGETSYQWLQARIDPLRAAYAAAGFGHGHRVGLLLENRPAFLLHWFALNALGASVVPINAEMRSAELVYLLGHSEMALAVTLPERAADLGAAAAQAGIDFETMGTDDVVPPAGKAPPRPHDGIGLDSECALVTVPREGHECAVVRDVCDDDLALLVLKRRR